MSNQALESVMLAAVPPPDEAEIRVKFPCEGCSYTFEEATNSDFGRFLGAKGGLAVIRVSLTDEARVTITGFGMLFANADTQVEGWVNENKPIINNLTLLDVLHQEEFLHRHCLSSYMHAKQSI
ncbi:hypothetical protein GGI42DRAFT_356725 [Trichoderma sp. SZMC 28013]